MAADLTFQDSIAISQLFEYKGWLIDEKNKSSLFNRFLLVMEITLLSFYSNYIVSYLMTASSIPANYL